MDVSNLLSYDTPRETRSQQAIQAISQPEQQRFHPYSTRHAALNGDQHTAGQDLTTSPTTQTYDNNVLGGPTDFDCAPPSPTPKNVAFELLFEGATNYRARLPMRVQIFPHDTTDSIVTTVKNFYGLYEGTAKGVSFEDEQRNTLIARYENFRNNMIVYVRVIQDCSPTENGHTIYHSASPVSDHRIPHLDEALQMLPPQAAQTLGYGQPPSRPQSRVARKRSLSPHGGRSRRSISAQQGHSRSGTKSREESTNGNAEDLNNDAINGYSSSDGGAGSVTGSRKARSEQLASAEISLDNILEGGRRKRAKFESSELPLFVPPQVPAPNSISSISPQRRSNGHENPSPFARPTQRNFVYSQPLQSPQSYGFNENSYGINPPSGTAYSAAPAQHSHRLRERTNAPHTLTRALSGATPRGQGFGILPTPDPTIASCISDEDVALQLMRLGDASNVSHGRTSASTLDDALSGRADIASSVTSESGDDSDTTEQPSLPAPNRPKSEASPSHPVGQCKRHYKLLKDGLPSFDSPEPSGDEVDDDYVYDEKKDGVFKSDPDDLMTEFNKGDKPKAPPTKVASGGNPKSRSGAPKKVPKISKPKPTPAVKKLKTSAVSNGFKTPLSPASLTPQSRKTSSASTLNFQHQLGADEEDLSSKPRCQRCRKSKKGCDRQRPCQRCQDAGIGAEGCISEDEGNGRKGRFGRHMGVSVKKDSQDTIVANNTEIAEAASNVTATNTEKSKKRKR